MNYKTILGTFLISLILFTSHISLAQNTTHIVEQGETLYSIARQYGIHISELLKANSQIEDNIIHIGDVIQIPKVNNPSQKSISVELQNPPTPKPKAIENSNPFDAKSSTPITSTTTNSTTTKKIENTTFPMIEHVVKEKETLYAISKLYNVSVDEIKAWNHLDNNDIKTGSVLLIKKQNDRRDFDKLYCCKHGTIIAFCRINKRRKEEVKKEEVAKPVTSIPTVVTEPIKNTKAAGPQKQLEDKFIEDMRSGKTAHSTNATISWISTTNDNNSFYGLHKTASVGSVVKVTNLVNKRVTFVKILGKLPETADNANVTMRLSNAAKNALLLNGDKAFVGIIFYE
ncbi:MAG: LysM peptidoglycan-binding domain-containing protein [Chitinophagales bacterium]|nr:LysM peptidoglycan-binding domain-containing protein [Chitinophagales bacterium]